jgi:hypothetical protein
VLVAAAVCPSPPLLVPDLAGGAAVELDGVRDWCRTAVKLLDGVVYVVGADLGLRATTFAPWGVDVAVDVPEPLPLPLLVGAWLTRGSLRSFVVVDAGLEPEECGDLGHELAASADRVSLLVIGDGSARRSPKAPGYFDERAEAFDAEVARVLAEGDLGALAAIDPASADALLVAGLRPWLVLAGAAADRGRPKVELAESAAPYGVGYFVAGYRWS